MNPQPRAESSDDDGCNNQLNFQSSPDPAATSLEAPAQHRPVPENVPHTPLSAFHPSTADRTSTATMSTAASGQVINYTPTPPTEFMSEFATFINDAQVAVSYGRMVRTYLRDISQEMVSRVYLPSFSSNIYPVPTTRCRRTHLACQTPLGQACSNRLPHLTYCGRFPQAMEVLRRTYSIELVCK